MTEDTKKRPGIYISQDVNQPLNEQEITTWAVRVPCEGWELDESTMLFIVSHTADGYYLTIRAPETTLNEIPIILNTVPSTHVPVDERVTEIYDEILQSAENLAKHEKVRPAAGNFPGDHTIRERPYAHLTRDAYKEQFHRAAVTISADSFFRYFGE